MNIEVPLCWGHSTPFPGCPIMLYQRALVFSFGGRGRSQREINPSRTLGKPFPSASKKGLANIPSSQPSRMSLTLAANKRLVFWAWVRQVLVGHHWKNSDPKKITVPSYLVPHSLSQVQRLWESWAGWKPNALFGPYFYLGLPSTLGNGTWPEQKTGTYFYSRPGSWNLVVGHTLLVLGDKDLPSHMKKLAQWSEPPHHGIAVGAQLEVLRIMVLRKIVFWSVSYGIN